MSTESKTDREMSRAFLADMQLKLDQNEHKGGWREESISSLYVCLRGEIEELEEELTKILRGFRERLSWDLESMRAAQLECADIGNFAMMLHDVLGRQKEIVEADLRRRAVEKKTKQGPVISGVKGEKEKMACKQRPVRVLYRNYRDESRIYHVIPIEAKMSMDVYYRKQFSPMMLVHKYDNAEGTGDFQERNFQLYRIDEIDNIDVRAYSDEGKASFFFERSLLLDSSSEEHENTEKDPFSELKEAFMEGVRAESENAVFTDLEVEFNEESNVYTVTMKFLELKAIAQIDGYSFELDKAFRLAGERMAKGA